MVFSVVRLPPWESPWEWSFSSTNATSSLLSFRQQERGVNTGVLYTRALTKPIACKQISGEALRKQPTTSHSQECPYVKKPHRYKPCTVSKNQKYWTSHLQISLLASSVRNCSGLKTDLHSQECSSWHFSGCKWGLPT